MERLQQGQTDEGFDTGQVGAVPGQVVFILEGNVFQHVMLR